jgi:hypothetical protein
MQQTDVDSNAPFGIMSPKEVAVYLRKSESWVYKNWQMLGGRKLKGSLFFPTKGDLYERLFGKGNGMEVRLHPEKGKVFKQLVRDQSGSPGGGSEKKGGNQKPEPETGTRTDDGNDPNRHGLLGPRK